MRGYKVIALENPKRNCNIGGVLRAAGCFRADLVVTSGNRYSETSVDTQKAWKHIPFQQVESIQKVIPYNCVPVAVELTKSAKNIEKFTHPERAFYVFGPEDGSISEELLNLCKYTIYIPTQYCLNLACCVNIVLFDRMMKRKEY